MNLAARILASTLSGRASYLVVFLVVHGVLAISTTGPTPENLAAFVLIAVPAAVVTLRWRLARWPAMLCVVSLVAAVVVSAGNFPEDGEPPGYAAWSLGAVTIVLLGLTLLGRGAIAWAGMAAVVAVCVAWEVLEGEGAAAGLDLVVRHIGTLLIGTLFAIGIARSNGRLAVYSAVQRRERAAERAAEARRAERTEEAAAVLEIASPALRAIAAGHGFTEEDRRELLVIEGRLRDRIRARSLMVDGLPDAVARARRRDVNVLLIDQAGPADDEARAAAAGWLSERLNAADSGRFVGRVRDDDGGLRVTAVTDAGRSTIVVAVASTVSDQ